MFTYERKQGERLVNELWLRETRVADCKTSERTVGKRVLPAFKSEIEAVLVHSQSQIATVK